jgi:hypothetical protein
VILLAALYQEPSSVRSAELAECLRRNCENPCVDEVHVLLEDDGVPGLDHPKLRTIRHGRRLTFRDAFAYASAHLRGKRVILANTDIYFDRSLARLEGYPLANRLLCLSRWDVKPDGSSSYFDFGHSQDAWIFESPLREFSCNWHLGIPGCDNRLTYEAEQAGLEVLNPSRSIRAHHLHLSNVRHYTERQRLPGPVRAVPGTFLGTPWVNYIVTGATTADAARTVHSLCGQPRSAVVAVVPRDPEGQLRALHPEVTLIEQGGSSAQQRQRGAAAADDDAILCFVPGGLEAPSDLADAMLRAWSLDALLTAEGPGTDRLLACSKAAFNRVGGLDDLIASDGEDLADLREVLRAFGAAERPLPAVRCSGAEPSPTAADEPTRTIDRGYSRAKVAVLRETRRPLSLSARREIRRAVERRWFAERGQVPDAPCASVAFRERMGYSVRRLEAGVSSHTNDPRPFLSIPPPLAGKPFTQVVASRVSPVEVEFRSPGKLYVLVGTDWYGYYPATEFLRDRGLREPLPAVATRNGTGFEVWSILGEAGESLTLPTQVMLVAEELVQP